MSSLIPTGRMPAPDCRAFFSAHTDMKRPSRALYMLAAGFLVAGLLVGAMGTLAACAVCSPYIALAVGIGSVVGSVLVVIMFAVPKYRAASREQHCYERNKQNYETAKQSVNNLYNNALEMQRAGGLVKS